MTEDQMAQLEELYNEYSYIKERGDKDPGQQQEVKGIAEHHRVHGVSPRQAAAVEHPGIEQGRGHGHDVAPEAATLKAAKEGQGDAAEQDQTGEHVPPPGQPLRGDGREEDDIERRGVLQHRRVGRRGIPVGRHIEQALGKEAEGRQQLDPVQLDRKGSADGADDREGHNAADDARGKAVPLHRLGEQSAEAPEQSRQKEVHRPAQTPAHAVSSVLARRVWVS